MTVFLIILLIVLLLASAFFSSSETALFSINHTTLERWRQEGSPSQNLVSKLMADHHRTLTVILLGTNFVNISTAFVFNTLAGNEINNMTMQITGSENQALGPVVASLCVTSILLVFGEVTPKAIAFAKAQVLAPAFAPTLNFICICLKWLAVPISTISANALRTFGNKSEENSTAINVDEYDTFIELGNTMGVFNEDEVSLFRKVFDLRVTNAAKIMIPRTDVCYVSQDLTPDELFIELRRYQHSFLPVVDEDLDNIKGILDVKAFCQMDPEHRDRWQENLQPPLYVPEKSKLNIIYGELKKSRQGMALVVDEYGGIEGMITSEDIYEQLVGDLSDEFDQNYWSITKITDYKWRVNGHIPLKELCEEFEFDIAESSADSLGGYISESFERIPEVGDELQLGDFTVRVISMANTRVLDVDLIKDKKAQP